MSSPGETEADRRARLLALVTRVASPPEGTPEEQIDDWLDELSREGVPAVTNWIFHDDLAPAEVVERMLAYRPIVLPMGHDRPPTA
ncbi:MAG: hypothetical protein M9894_06050 [Planctomycetes bacterium]|nr:hypothetical protein [Planctomycetota bacterium]